MQTEMGVSSRAAATQVVGKRRIKIPRAARSTTPSIGETAASKRRRSMPRPALPGDHQLMLRTENQEYHEDEFPARGHSPGDDEPWLRYVAAARVLGISRGTLEVWLCTKRYAVPFYKIGRNVLFKRSELLVWLESRRHGGDVVSGERTADAGN